MKSILIIHLISSLNVFHTLAAAISSRSSGNLICAQHGWETTTDSFLDFSYGSSYADCAGACKYHTQCVSFAYSYNSTGDNSFDCQLFNVPASGNFVVDDSSPYIFYDLACEAARKMCNVKGYAKINAFTTFPGSSISDCAATCDGDNEYISEECSSYAFGQGTCYFFDYLVADNVNLNSNSPYVFSDYLCDSSSSSTTTMAASTTTSKTTTRTTTKPATTTTTTTSSTNTSGKTSGTASTSSAPRTSSTSTASTTLSTTSSSKSSSSTSSKPSTSVSSTTTITTQSTTSSSTNTTTSISTSRSSSSPSSSTSSVPARSSTTTTSTTSSSTSSAAGVCKAITSTVTVYAIPSASTTTGSIIAASKI